MSHGLMKSPMMKSIPRIILRNYSSLPSRTTTNTLRAGPEPINTKTLSGDQIDPWHGSYHWIYERALSVASLGLIGTAMLGPPLRLVDLALGVVIPLHCHIGFGAIITDYLPKRKFPLIYPISRAFLWLATAGTLYGLYRFNTKDVGITEGVSRLWKKSTSNDIE